jgi:anaerobic selenocysteine-containing dehydrogenase
MTEQAYHTCPLCEATCGLVTTLEGGQPKVVRGDRQHPLSKGFICPKGASLPAVHADPDRLRAPMVRQGDRLVETTWDAAFERAGELIDSYLATHDRTTLASYIGNPSAHNLSLMLYGSVLVKALGTTNVYTSGSVDTVPLQTVHALLYGDSYAITVPDLDRTDLFVIFGGNPVVSNGSMMSAPNIKGRFAAIRDRGGRVIVVDPRRSETARVADQHVALRPGTDVWLLAAIVNHVFQTRSVDDAFARRWLDGVEAVEAAVKPFTFELAAARCGVDAALLRDLADQIVHGDRVAVYGRMGTSTQRFGGVCLWLIATLNAITGHVDRPGGVMFPLGASLYRRPSVPQSRMRARWHSRVRRLPEQLGELPAVTLAEDILEPGAGRIRGLVTVAGNPVLSVPDGGAMERAMADLELLICVDTYLNETTRHADVVFPGESPLQRVHFPFLARFGVHNAAQWSDPVLPPETGRPREWQVLTRLAAMFDGRPHIDVDADDDERFARRVAAEVRDLASPIHGRPVEEIIEEHAGVRGPERLMDMRLRLGPYGDHYGARPTGLSVAALRAQPSGVDLGPLRSRLDDVIATESGRIELWHDELGALLAAAAGDGGPGDHLLLISRRSLRSNNSWMHNIPRLASGEHRCTLEINPDDAAALGIDDRQLVKVRSVSDEITVPVEISDSMRRGVVCLPHGWGHDRPGTRMSVASERPGANSNRLGDPRLVEGLTATAVTNGIPVSLELIDADDAKTPTTAAAAPPHPIASRRAGARSVGAASPPNVREQQEQLT